MHLSSSPRGAVLALFIAFGLLAVVTPVDAQLEANIEITAEQASGLAMPEGDPASIPINITYQCAGLRGTVDIEVSVDANASGASASVEPATFEAASPPGCEVGAKAPAVPAVIKVTASKDNIAGSLVPVTVTVKGKNALDQEQSKSLPLAAEVGSYFEVTADVRTTEFEVPAGDRADFFVDVESKSNVKIMYMPTFLQVPAGWSKPNTTPIEVETPLVEGKNGTDVWQTELVVPADTEPGEYEMVFQSYAHTMGEGETLELPRGNHTLKITVTAGAGGGGDDEESPAPPVFLVAIGAVAILGLLRRRQ